MSTKGFFALALLLSLATSSLAGPPIKGEDGWISSGGEIFLYSRNPWFVKNVSTVNYCVLIDTATVTAPENVVRDSVREAFQYWKNEIGLAMPQVSKGFAALATQNFVEQSTCDEATTDIHFKVGYGALTTDEVKYLHDPTIYVGVSVRTDYDLKKLRGKGFVYISSDKGPNSYRNGGELVVNAWQEPKLLRYALIHEVGHIMGLPHMGTGIMSEVFLNQVLNVRFSQFYLNSPTQSFLLEPRSFEVCDMSGSFNPTFFMVPSSTACLKLEAEDAAAETWKVFSSAKKNGPYSQIGFVRFTGFNFTDLSAKPAMVIQLPPEQTVFSASDRFMNNFILGPLFKNRNVQGHFETMTSHKPYPLQIQLSPDAVSFTGVVGGLLMPVMVYAQPSLLNMLIPVH